MARSRRDTVLTEHIEQREFVSWFRQTHPEVRIFAIPNGGHRDKVTAMKMKAEGVSSGVPDLFVPSWRLWIEMKTVGGKLSTDQKDWVTYLRDLGYTVIVPQGNLAGQAMVADFLETMFLRELKSRGPKSDSSAD